MNTFHLTVSTPDGNRFSDEAAGLYVRGAAGDLAVLAGHIPFVTAVQPGMCRIALPDGSEKTARIDGGLLTVSAAGTTLLSGSFQFEDTAE